MAPGSAALAASLLMFAPLALAANDDAGSLPCSAGELAKLTEASPFNQDQLGYAVALDRDVAVIGAPGDSDAIHQGGAVYVFRDDGSGWIDQEQLFPLDPGIVDAFGNFVGISGDTIVVGAHFEDGGGQDSGAAYVFEFDGAHWRQVAKLASSELAAYDNFGWSVAVSGDVIVVGANLDDESGPNSGAAYVFRKPEAGWTDMTETAKLVPTDNAGNDEFGKAVAIDGDVAVVGAHYDVDGQGSMVGSAYVYRYTGIGWRQEAKLEASDAAAHDRFGMAVAISGNTAVVGAWGDDDGGSMSGSAYVYERPPTGWTDMTQTAKLTASDATAGDHFGWTVAVDANSVVVGAPAHNWDGSGYGSVYVYDEPAGGWTDMTETARYAASDAVHEDDYGYAVAVSGNRLVAGSRWHDTGLNDKAGAAYVHGGLLDCQPNGVIDVCDLIDGASADGNANGIPDECEDPAGGGGSIEQSLVVDKAPEAMIELSWGPSCVVGDDDFEIYEGSLDDFASHTARICTTGGGQQVAFIPETGSTYYLVAPSNPMREGSLGKNSEGLERAQGTATCLPRFVSECP
jgi:hypothetical protein